MVLPFLNIGWNCYQEDSRVDKCLFYLDEMIVIGKELDDHLHNLKEVYTILRNTHLQLNTEKIQSLRNGRHHDETITDYFSRRTKRGDRGMN